MHTGVTSPITSAERGHVVHLEPLSEVIKYGMVDRTGVTLCAILDHSMQPLTPT